MDGEAEAEALGLRFVEADEPGITRVGSGGRVRYVGPDGRPVRDEGTLARLAGLAVPPAWTDVWLCADAVGHIQATGRDAKGRKQYRYHAGYRSAREDAKYGLLVPFGQALPSVRRRVAADLARRGMPRERILALVVQLLEFTAIRVGNDEYARANRSYGLTTLLDRHARFDPTGVAFTFRGKSGKDHRVAVTDRRVARLVRACQDLPGQRLFQYVDDDGVRHPVTSTDVNEYLRAAAPFPVTAKHFRTWAGTRQVAATLARASRPDAATARRRVVRDAIAATAAGLGNTPTVCRASYVHPTIPEAYEAGTLAELWWSGPSRSTRWLHVDERRLLYVLEALAVGTSSHERPLAASA